MDKYKVGSVVLLNRSKGKESNWFSKAQVFFTGKPYTHCANIIGDVLTQQAVLSADELITVEPLSKYFDEEGTGIEIWEMPSVSEDRAKIILKDLYLAYGSTYYGFTQLLWFVYRWFMEKLGKDVRKKINPFRNGEICSELIYHYWERLPEYFDLQKKLDEWNPDTVHAGDIHTIMTSFPDLFKLVYKRN